jgi:hypothetical protein
MDWTDLHCERQFKLVNKLFFHLLTLANVPEVSGRIRVSRCKTEKLAHPTDSNVRPLPSERQAPTHQSRNTVLQGIVAGETHSGRSSNGGFGLGKSKILYLSIGVD